jgi:hypothetical protein
VVFHVPGEKGIQTPKPGNGPGMPITGTLGVPKGGSMKGMAYRFAVAVKDAGERWNFPRLSGWV